jgi:hypothetical protein
VDTPTNLSQNPFWTSPFTMQPCRFVIKFPQCFCHTLLDGLWIFKAIGELHIVGAVQLDLIGAVRIIGFDL